MKLNIGDNIRAFRREKDITQEEFAAIIGVSYQSVSRWENNICYPDMELLPTIADFLGVTVDKLLGVSESIERQKVQEYLERFQEAISCGKVYDCIDIAREGLAEYPNNYVLLNKLMYALFVAGDEDGNIPEWKENMQKYDAEITALGERIMKYCPDRDIQLDATARLAFNHCEMGRKELGRKIYETLPSMEYCKENAMWWGLYNDEKLPFLRKKIKQSYEALRSSIRLLANSGCISDEQSILAINKVHEIEKILYDGINMPDSWEEAKLQVDIAKLYIRLDKHAEAIKHLYIGAAAANAFDKRPEKQNFSSILLGNVTVKRTDFETADTRSLSEIMRDKWLGSSEFDGIRNTNDFKQIIAQLSC